MGRFIVKQPNGRYCRFSTVVDCPTIINMTEDDYRELVVKEAVVEALRDADRILHKDADALVRDMATMDNYFMPHNMSKEMYEHYKKRMSLPDTRDLECERTQCVQESSLVWHNADEELPELGADVFVLVWEEDFPDRLQCDKAAYMPCDYKDSKGREWQTCNDWDEGQKWYVAYWAEVPEFGYKQ